MTTKEYYARYREEIKQKRRDYYQRTKDLPKKDRSEADRLYRERNRERIKERMNTPYWREYKQKYSKEYGQRDYVKERHRDSCRKYIHSSHGKDKMKQYQIQFEMSGRASYTRKIYRRDKRLALVSIMGGKCVICGIDDVNVLDIDHVNGDGRDERSIYGDSREVCFYYLKNPDKIPGRIQLLCKNCHYRKTHKERYG